MAESMTVIVKGVPPSLNAFAGRNNVWDYRKTKQKWTWVVKTACMANKARPSKPWEKAYVEVVYFFPDGRRRDPDNYAPKAILDGLVRAGVIKDDCFRCITLTISGEVDKGNPRTEILIINKENET